MSGGGAITPLVFGSPLAGWVATLDDVPDAMFAGEADGIASIGPDTRSPRHATRPS